MERRYITDRHSTARAMIYIKRHAAQVKASGGIVKFMAGQNVQQHKTGTEAATTNSTNTIKNTQTEDEEPPPVFFYNNGQEAATFFENGLAMS